MSISPREARRWLAGFEAAARADRQAKRALGARPQWAIASALALIEAAGLAPDPLRADPGRERRDEAVRIVWQRLRSRLAR